MKRTPNVVYISDDEDTPKVVRRRIMPGAKDYTADLPFELMCTIVQFLPPQAQIVFQFVSKTAYGTTHAEDCKLDWVTDRCLINREYNPLLWALEKEYPLLRNYLYATGCPITNEVYTEYTPTLSSLVWLSEHRPTLYYRNETCVKLIAGGNLQALQYLFDCDEVGMPISPNSANWDSVEGRIVRAQDAWDHLDDVAIKHGHLHILKWLLINGKYNSKGTAVSAAHHGRLDILQWLESEFSGGVSLIRLRYEVLLSIFITKNNLDAVHWLSSRFPKYRSYASVHTLNRVTEPLSVGINFSQYTGTLDTITQLQEMYGYRIVHESTDIYSDLPAKLEVLEYAYNHSAYPEEDIASSILPFAISRRHLEIIKWAFLKTQPNQYDASDIAHLLCRTSKWTIIEWALSNAPDAVKRAFGTLSTTDICYIVNRLASNKSDVCDKEPLKDEDKHDDIKLLDWLRTNTNWPGHCIGYALKNVANRYTLRWHKKQGTFFRLISTPINYQHIKELYGTVNMRPAIVLAFDQGNDWVIEWIVENCSPRAHGCDDEEANKIFMNCFYEACVVANAGRGVDIMKLALRFGFTGSLLEFTEDGLNLAVDRAVTAQSPPVVEWIMQYHRGATNMHAHLSSPLLHHAIQTGNVYILGTLKKYMTLSLHAINSALLTGDKTVLELLKTFPGYAKAARLFVDHIIRHYSKKKITPRDRVAWIIYRWFVNTHIFREDPIPTGAVARNNYRPEDTDEDDEDGDDSDADRDLNGQIIQNLHVVRENDQ